MTDSDDNRPARTRPARFGRWPSELFQLAPLIVFVNMRRLGFDYEERFLAGAGAALLVVALLIALRVPLTTTKLAASSVQADVTRKRHLDRSGSMPPVRPPKGFSEN